MAIRVEQFVVNIIRFFGLIRANATAAALRNVLKKILRAQADVQEAIRMALRYERLIKTSQTPGGGVVDMSAMENIDRRADTMWSRLRQFEQQV